MKTLTKLYEAEDVFKANGLKTKEIEGVFKNSYSGRSNSKAIGLFNEKGEIFHLDGKPYFPIGGRAAFKAIIEDGLNHKGYSFKPFKQ